MGITVSIGVASYPKDASMEEELMRMADERLYKAKASGRNRVCSD
jgi:diguanylate cyclase (GGDEF)-like protein